MLLLCCACTVLTTCYFLLKHLEYKLRFTASEWARIEHELTRERGLWGPEKPSFLDKWMLDSVEGKCMYMYHSMLMYALLTICV